MERAFIILNIPFDYDFLPLLLIIGAAWFVPVFINAIHVKRVPSVVLEILAGFIIAFFFKDIVTHENHRILDFFALFGFIFLMFMSGLEINTDQIISSLPVKRLKIKSTLYNPLYSGLIFFCIALALSFLSSLLLGKFIPISNFWYFSLIMVTTSVGIVIPVLKDRGETGTRYGQAIITAAVIADIISIILFTITAFILKSGFKVEILNIFFLFIAFIIAFRFGKHIVNKRQFKKFSFELGHAATQITIRGTLLIILIFIVISQLIGEEVVLLGAFLAGLLLSSFMHKDRSVLLLKLDGMGYGFFIPLFFIMVGFNFDPASLAEFDNGLWTILLFMLVVLYTIRLIPSLIWRKIFGTRRAIAGGILLTSQLSLIIAASQIGLSLEIITPGINACFIIVAVITCFISPVLFNSILPVRRVKKERIIIIGGSSTGVLLARRLKIHQKETVIIEHDYSRYKDIIDKGIKAAFLDATQPITYKTIDLKPNDYVVVLTGNPETNMIICEQLKHTLGHENIVTIASKSIIDKKLYNIDIQTLDINRTIASTIENLILRPIAYDALIESFKQFNIEEVTLNNPAYAGKQIKDIPFHPDGSIILLKQKGTFNVPKGNSFLRMKDELVIIGTDEALNDTRNKLEKQP